MFAAYCRARLAMVLGCVAVAVGVALSGGCSTNGPDALGGPIDAGVGTLRISIHWPARDGAAGGGVMALAVSGQGVGVREIPAKTESIGITVSASDIAVPITEVVTRPSVVDPLTEVTLRVPPGEDRVVLVEARDGYGILLATCSVVTDVAAGATTDVYAQLGPVELISMIAFSSDRSGNWDIWVVYPDGTGLKQLTQGPEEDFQPTWSPDGSRIAFGRKDASGWDIWAVSPDGQECQKLADGLCPTDWSPDGTRLAVENLQDAGDVLEEYDLATGVSTPLGSLPGPSGRGCYSPDGASLLFQAMGQHWEIWRVDFGSTPQRVLGGSSLAYADPAWSPDGQMMALCHHPTALDPEDVFVARPDGTGLRNVTQSYSSQDILPNWSPDGSQIVFVSNRNGGRHLFTVSPSGGPVTQLTSGACLDREPEWSPLFYPHERQ